jgi:hypothetical protein
MAWRYHDGERPKDCSQEIADCAIRAITIATGEPYTLVAGRLQQIEVALAEEENKHWLAALGSVFAGCSEEAIALYFNEIGWTYFAWPGGETVPFCEDNMPHKPAVANLKTHVVAVLYRVVLDMTNPQLVTTNGLQVTWRRLHGFWAPR